MTVTDYLALLRILVWPAVGPKTYPDGVKDSDEREFLRPLRNAGLIHTQPRGERLKKATAIELSGLGRLYLRALGQQSEHGA